MHPFLNGVVSSGAVTVTGIGLVGTFITMCSSMDSESMLHSVSLEWVRTDGNRPVLR